MPQMYSTASAKQGRLHGVYSAPYGRVALNPLNSRLQTARKYPSAFRQPSKKVCPCKENGHRVDGGAPDASSMEGAERAVANARKKHDEDALTAVIEFLSAFVLFLVIVSAFLALSQLKLGSNVAEADRFDQMAIDGLEKLTDSKGHVVLRDAGIRDIANSTDDWHLFNASTLLTADLLPAIGDGAGHLDMQRISALGNVTEDRLIHGLGIDEGLNLNLTITVVQTEDESRIGTEIFSDGTSRASATRGSTASRTMYLDNELVRVTLEVHNAGREPAGLRITEFMADPLNGPPEWVELENPDGFAMNLSGWSLASPGAFQMIGDEALGAGQRLICTGNALTQYNPNNAMMVDFGASGVLGTGSIDMLAADIQANHSMIYNFGGTPDSATNWTALDIGTPGW